MSQVPLFVLSRLLSSLWVSRTGSASDWCALHEALYKCIDTIQYNLLFLDLFNPYVIFVELGLMVGDRVNLVCCVNFHLCLFNCLTRSTTEKFYSNICRAL